MPGGAFSFPDPSHAVHFATRIIVSSHQISLLRILQIEDRFLKYFLFFSLSERAIARTAMGDPMIPGRVWKKMAEWSRNSYLPGRAEYIPARFS
jgi:hypothetical protein